MCVTAIPAQTARNRFDSFVSSAGKRRRQASKIQVHSLIRPDQSIARPQIRLRTKNAYSKGKISRSWRQTAGCLRNVGLFACFHQFS
jgi:hypothetical protein